MQALLNKVRGADSVPLAVRQEIWDVNATMATTVVNDGDAEPDLSRPIVAGYKSTWGERKSICELEARSDWAQGASPADNPYIKNTWPNKWWTESFSKCEGPRNKTMVSILN